MDKHKHLNNKSSNDMLEDETAFREEMLEAARQEGRALIEENEQLKKEGNPNYKLTTSQYLNLRDQILSNSSTPAARNHRKINKVVLSAVILLLGLLISLISVSSLRDWTIEFLLGIDGTNGSVYKQEEIIVRGEKINSPAVLPDGYFCTSLRMDHGMSIIEYSDNDEGIIIFTQRKDGAPGTIDTENAEVETVTINGNDGRISIGEDGSNVLIWAADDKFFTITSNENKAVLIKIAESVSIN